MIALRRAAARGHFDFGWLDARHTFSFAEYYDPNQMGFRTLRVINEDRVQPGRGFPTHGHRDMEIVSYVLEGALQHRDNLGTGSVIRPGEIQRMSTRLNSSHSQISYAVFCLKKKKKKPFNRHSIKQKKKNNNDPTQVPHQ